MACLQSVTVGQKVFVGGGVTSSLDSDDDERTVYEYDEDSNQWVSLKPYNYRRFAMAILADKLTLVGGWNLSTLWETSQVAVWEGEGTPRGWTYPYPPMTTPRHSPAVATYEDRLLVAGGRDYGTLATVEVFNTTSHQWLSTSPLPVGCAYMTSAIVNQELFLLGGDTDYRSTCCVPPRHNTEQCSLRHYQQIRAMAYPPRTSTEGLCCCLFLWISTSHGGSP